MQRYLIGEVAELFGITKGGIRHYEELGILHPSRDEMNGYRYYQRDDITDLKIVRSFQLMGFSLEESYKLSMSGSVNDVLDHLDMHEEKLRQQAERISRAISLVRMRRELLQFTGQKENSWFRTLRAPMYRIPVWQEQRRIQHTADTTRRMLEIERSWTAAMSVVSLCDYYYQGPGGLEFEKGSCVTEDMAAAFDIKLEDSLVEYYPSCDCWCICVQRKPGAEVLATVEQGIEQLGTMGLTAGKDMLGQVIHAVQGQQKHCVHLLISIPVACTQTVPVVKETEDLSTQA